MTENEKHQTVGLVGPIELGKTSKLPEEIMPGEEIFSEYFTLDTDAFDQESLLSVLLPKFILSPGNSVKEKSFLLLTIEGKHIPSTYSQVLKAAKSGIDTFEIHFFNTEKEMKAKKKNKEKSSWKFINPRVHAVDFGYVARERPDEPTISVEMDYESIIIDGVTF